MQQGGKPGGGGPVECNKEANQEEGDQWSATRRKNQEEGDQWSASRRQTCRRGTSGVQQGGKHAGGGPVECNKGANMQEGDQWSTTRR